MAIIQRRNLRNFSSLYILLFLSLFVQHGKGLYENEAGVIDWHQKYVGTPRISLFHRTSRGVSILTATDRNVIASLSAHNGNVEWRQVFEESERIFTFISHETNALSVSNRDGSNMIRLWDVDSGSLIWEQKVAEKTGKSNDNSSETNSTVDAIFATDKSGVFILLDGASVTKFSIRDGKQLWKAIIDENSSKTITFTRIVHYGAALQVVGLKTTNNKSYAIEVVTLDATIGDTLRKNTLVSKVASLNDIIVIGGESNNGFVVWKEGPHMRVNRFGTVEIDEAPLEALYGNVIPSFKDANGPLELINLNLGSRTEFLAQIKTTHGSSAAVFKVDPEGGRLAVLYDLEERPGKSIYSAVVDKTNSLIVSRSRRESEESIKIEIVAPASRRVLAIHSISHSLKTSGCIQKSILDVDNKQKEKLSYQIFMVSQDQSVYFWQDGRFVWKREESLAHAIQVEFLDFPERKLWSQDIDELEEAETTTPLARYIRRLKTHIYQLQDLPFYIPTYIKHFVTGDYSSFAGTPSSDDRKVKSLYRDTFGFRKLLIFVTPKKLVALDTANKGDVVWSRYFDHSIKELYQIFIVRTAFIKYPPALVALGVEYKAESSTLRLFRINALTGEDFTPDNGADFPADYSFPFIPKQVYKLPIEEPEERTHILALVDEALKIHLYPNYSGARKAFAQLAPSFYFSLVDMINGKSLSGYRISNTSVQEESFESAKLWKINFPEGELIKAISERSPYEKVASLGRVLGDRSVLYKYLNPHLISVATYTNTSQDISTLNIYLIDVVKGSILYQTSHENVGTIYPVHIIQIENYILYHFWIEGEFGKSTTEKGYVVVIYDLYEGANKDERVDSSVFSSFAHERPHVSAQAFIFPYGVNALGVTTTKHGVATREFLFALKTDQVFGLSKRFLDPRRPTAALTADDKEEMLIPYEPVLPDNKKFILSYNLTIAGIRHIVTSPALLESTSLVVAYGLDIWFTREAPSKTFDVLSEDFSKGTLLATIAGLVLGIAITGPMVRRKNVNSRWY
ncbi:hypothetical protein G9A89_002890 [Geosiphon pyriformis]|nr:hypothetical protein G9A89_002890 [Geosiphon pyriformis]